MEAVKIFHLSHEGKFDYVSYVTFHAQKLYMECLLGFARFWNVCAVKWCRCSLFRHLNFLESIKPMSCGQLVFVLIEIPRDWVGLFQWEMYLST